MSAVAQPSEVDPENDVGFDQKLGERAPMDLTFRDESGEPTTLAELADGKPVILAPVYYECPMLCTLTLNGLLRAARTLQFDAGDQYEIVAVSIDPYETHELAATKKDEYLKMYRREESEGGWHFLTGDESSIRPLMDAIGFRYAYDPKIDEYAHSAGLVVLTPEGKVSRYFYGVEYSARDLRLGLIEAAGNNIGSPVDQVLLLCYHYDPKTGKYGLLIMNVVRLLGGLTVAILAGGVAAMIVRERRRKRRRNDEFHPAAPKA